MGKQKKTLLEDSDGCLETDILSRLTYLRLSSFFLFLFQPCPFLRQ